MKSTCVMAALAVFLCTAAQAQEAGSLEAQSVTDTRNADWKAVLAAVTHAPGTTAPGTTREVIESTRNARIEQARGNVALLREFGQKHNGHLLAKEAKRMEALALLDLAELGDDAERERRNELVSEIRSDKSLSQALRSEVAARADNLAIRRRRDLTPDARLAAFETTVRALIAEFPEVAEGYESLWAIASARSRDHALAVSRELLTMAAPDHVKDRAKHYLRRQYMVGRTLDSVIAAASDETRLVFQRAVGRRLVIYSWSSASRTSVALAKRLAGSLPAGVGLVGICLDERIEPAKEVARTEGLSDAQVYSVRGSNGPVSLALAIDTVGLLYVVDERGVIASVSAHSDLQATINSITGQ